jgi:hypothetical protein
VEVYMAITRGLCTLADVKSALRITDNVDDSILELNIEAASREIENHCERQFTSGTATRVYVPQDAYTVQIDDLVSLTTLKTSSTGETFDTTWSAGDYQLEPLNGLAGGLETPFTRIRAIGDYLFPIWDPTSVNAIEATVQVTGTFGFATVPTAVRQACVFYSARLYKRNDSPLGSYGMGDLGVVHVRRIDPDIEALLAPFRKVRMA